MSVHNTGESSRKPSGSSTHSVGHSPTSSPNNVHSQRKLTPAAAGNMFGVGMSTANGLKSLNSGWQVWGASTPSSKRNPSVSSATSMQEPHPSQADPNFRGGIGENWAASRSTSGTWEDVESSVSKKDYSQLDSLNLHHARQRQTNANQPSGFSGSRIDDRTTGSKGGQLSPQRYDHGLGKDSNTTRFTASTSPTSPFSGIYSAAQQSGLQTTSGPGYDTLPSTGVDHDLSLAFRGMAVEDDFSVQNRQQPVPPQVIPVQSSNLHVRIPPPMPQTRSPYSAYPQADYGTFYPTTPGPREPYPDYAYGYDAYRSPSDLSLYQSAGMSISPPNIYLGVASQNVHSATLTDIHRQPPGPFYDYPGATRPPGSQFYFPTPHQPMLYPPPHSPMTTPQLASAGSSALVDKKREVQYNPPQALATPNLMYTGIRSSPTSHPQGFATAMDYGMQLPLIIPGAPIYNPQAMQFYSHGLHLGRHGDVTDPSVAFRSALLQEFRGNKSRKWELKDIFGHIVEFSGDQHGSRFIQQKLECATSEEKQTVFDEIVPHNTLQLIQDVFGNYVVQKLFEHGTQVQKTVLANTMEGHILTLSLQMYGCRVVQRAIEYILPEQQASFVRELEPHVLKCVKDANGNHVIQKIIQRVAPERLGFVTSFRNSVYDLSTHPYGCRVLQRCLEHLPEELTRPLMDELHKYNLNLMQDQFGNYVVQFVVEHGKEQDRDMVVAKLHGHVLHMARHKFASNVVEKVLVCVDLESRRLLIDEIITPKSDGSSPVVAMMKDQFANYVLQRALSVAEGDQRDILINLVRPQLITMRRFSNAYSKHLLSIERLLERLPAPQSPHEV